MPCGLAIASVYTPYSQYVTARQSFPTNVAGLREIQTQWRFLSLSARNHYARNPPWFRDQGFSVRRRVFTAHTLWRLTVVRRRRGMPGG